MHECVRVRVRGRVRRKKTKKKEKQKQKEQKKEEKQEQKEEQKEKEKEDGEKEEDANEGEERGSGVAAAGYGECADALSNANVIAIGRRNGKKIRKRKWKGKEEEDEDEEEEEEQQEAEAEEEEKPEMDLEISQILEWALGRGIFFRGDARAGCRTRASTHAAGEGRVERRRRCKIVFCRRVNAYRILGVISSACR